MNNTTAVEWLISIIERYIEHLSEDDLENLSDLFEQALEMEKQEIIEAAIWMPNNFGTEFLPELGKQYYKERYGKEKL
jgi:hypothetical protein